MKITTYSIGNMLKQSRIASGMTQEEVAIKLDVDPTVICKLERDKSNPTFNTILKYMDAVGHEFEITPFKI